MTSDELSALNFFEVCEAMRAGTVSPDTAADETLYRPTLTIAAVNRGIEISGTASRARHAAHVGGALRTAARAWAVTRTR